MNVFAVIGEAGGDFAPVSAELERRGGRRVRARDADGDHDAYLMPDGRVVAAVLRVPSPARIAADAAAATAAAALDSKRATALQLVRDQVARVRGVAAGSRTNADKWLLALSLLFLSEE
jgi:hypothetical protein